MGRMRDWLTFFFTRSFLVRLGVLAALVAVGGVGVLVSGVVPVKASSGHWPITAWVLNFASSRSVATHSTGIQVPPLEDPDLVMLGGAHFEAACQWCHGSPSEQRPRVAGQMTPPPPYLPNVLAQWDNAERFYIVKHGIKFAGMPAWSSRLRDDDVWPVIAFLNVLPTLDAAQYQRVVGRDIQAPETMQPELAQLLLRCAACHGLEGRGRVGEHSPMLAGQREDYLYGSLASYASAERHSGIMEPIAARLTPSQMKLLSKYFSAQSPVNAEALQHAEAPQDAKALQRAKASQDAKASHDAELVSAGRRIAIEGRLIDGSTVAACASCHQAENAKDQSMEGARPRAHFPLLAGQSSTYLEKQLQLFGQRIRGGTRYHHLMYPAAELLGERDRAAAAAFYGSLPSTIASPAAQPHGVAPVLGTSESFH